YAAETRNAEKEPARDHAAGSAVLEIARPFESRLAPCSVQVGMGYPARRQKTWGPGRRGRDSRSRRAERLVASELQAALVRDRGRPSRPHPASNRLRRSGCVAC